MKLQTIIDSADILQHLTFTLAGRDMKSLIECVLLCSSLVTSLINMSPSSLSLGPRASRTIFSLEVYLPEQATLVVSFTKCKVGDFHKTQSDLVRLYLEGCHNTGT